MKNEDDTKAQLEWTFIVVMILKFFEIEATTKCCYGDSWNIILQEPPLKLFLNISIQLQSITPLPLLKATINDQRYDNVNKVVRTILEYRLRFEAHATTLMPHIDFQGMPLNKETRDEKMLF